MPNRLKMLVAEDCELDALLLKRALQQTAVAINAQFVRDGQEAIDYLQGAGAFADRTAHPMPAVIVLDIKMPRMNGFDVLKWLKAQPRHARTPVILFSGSDDARDVDRAYALGACTYMVKPGPTGSMLALARLIDEYWRQNAKLPPTAN